MRFLVVGCALQLGSALGADLVNQKGRPLVVVRVIEHDRVVGSDNARNPQQEIFKLHENTNERAEVPLDPLNVPTIYDNKYDPNSPVSTAGMLLTPAATTSADYIPAAIPVTPIQNSPRPSIAVQAATATPAYATATPTATLARATSTVTNPRKPMPPGIYNPPVTTTLSFEHPIVSTRSYTTTAHVSTKKSPRSRPYSTTTHAPTATSTTSYVSSTVVVIISTTTTSWTTAATGHHPSAEPTTYSNAVPSWVPMTVDSYTDSVASAQPGDVPTMAMSTTKKKSGGVKSDFAPWVCLSAWWLVIGALVLL